MQNKEIFLLGTPRTTAQKIVGKSAWTSRKKQAAEIEAVKREAAVGTEGEIEIAFPVEDLGETIEVETRGIEIGWVVLAGGLVCV